MSDDHYPGMRQVTAVDDRFCTHRVQSNFVGINDQRWGMR
jgi:hypothetical protein